MTKPQIKTKKYCCAALLLLNKIDCDRHGVVMIHSFIYCSFVIYLLLLLMKCNTGDALLGIDLIQGLFNVIR